jgi:hypothetical protein
MIPSSITTTSTAAVIATLKSGIANESPYPGVTAPGKVAVIGQGLGETHTDAGPQHF